MKSRITIEVDFDNGNLPILQIINQHSDDVRDRLVGQFLQSFQHTSRWCKILYVGELAPNGEKAYRWVISPLLPNEIPEEIKLMQGVYERSEAYSEGIIKAGPQTNA